MNPLDYSKPINLWLTSDLTEYQKLVANLLGEIKAVLNLERFRIDEYKTPLTHILADLFITYKADPKRYLAYSRDKNWYSSSKEVTRYQPKRFALTPFTRVVDSLNSLGYINNVDGIYYPNMKKAARMIGKDKLIKLFDKHKLNEVNFYQLDTKESIILKTPKDGNDNTSKID